MTNDLTDALARPGGAADPPDPGPRDGGLRTPVRVLAVAVSLLLVGWGALTLASLLARGSGEAHASYAGVHSVVLDTGFESVDVVGSPGATAVRLDRTYHWALHRPTVRARLDGDLLRVSSACPFEIGVGCTGHLTLVVPPGITLTAATHDGHLVVSDLSGPVDAATSDGGLELRDLTGPVRLSTSDGSVQAQGLTSDRVTVGSSDGSVRLGFAEAPTAVRVSTSDGSVEITVPHDGTAYAVTVTTSDGSQQVQLPTDPAATRRIEVHTSDGSVHVTPAR